MAKPVLSPRAGLYGAGLAATLEGLPVRIVVHTQIFPGYDKIVRRSPSLARVLRQITYFMEHTPLRIFGLSHLLVIEKTS